MQLSFTTTLVIDEKLDEKSTHVIQKWKHSWMDDNEVVFTTTFTTIANHT